MIAIRRAFVCSCFFFVFSANLTPLLSVKNRRKCRNYGQSSKNNRITSRRIIIVCQEEARPTLTHLRLSRQLEAHTDSGLVSGVIILMRPDFCIRQWPRCVLRSGLTRRSFVDPFCKITRETSWKYSKEFRSKTAVTKPFDLFVHREKSRRSHFADFALSI